jgi:hypothetical protein
VVGTAFENYATAGLAFGAPASGGGIVCAAAKYRKTS